jgi:hypothetical protein
MLGWKKNAHAETVARKFFDRRSFVSRKEDGKLHDKLFGEDKRLRRQEVFDREGGICQKCGRYAPLNGDEGYRGAAHHILHKIWNRCDCKENLEWVCGRFVGTCHTDQHVRPKFSGGTPQ